MKRLFTLKKLWDMAMASSKFFNKDPNYDAMNFSKPVKGSDGRYFIRVSSENQELMCHFSHKTTASDNLTEESTVLAVAPTAEMVEFVRDSEERMLALCKDHKESWFPSQKMTDEWMDDAFLPSVKHGKKQQCTALNFRISKQLAVFDHMKDKQDKTFVTKDAEVSVIVQLAGLWFTKTRFGVTWLLRQVKVHPAATTLKFGECLFEDENIEEMDNVFPDE